MPQYKVHRVRFVDFTPKSINCAAFDNDSKLPKVAFSREDGSIEIRDPGADWVLVSIIPGQEGRTVEHLVWCDGRLFSGGMNSEIIEWNLELLKPLYQQDSYGGSVWSLKFSYSKKLLAAGCEDGSIRLFDVFRDSIMYAKCLNKQEHRILSLSWSHDDLMIVAGGFDCRMRVYDVKTGRVTMNMTTDNLKSGNTMVWSVNFLKDSTIVMGDSLGNTQFWDGITGTLLQTFKSHLADVLAVAVSHDEKMVFTTGIDSKVVQFVLLQNENKTSWFQTKNVRATNHDTRSLAICAEPYNCLVSGGIDPRFVVYPLNDFSSQTFVRYSCLPPSNVCQLAPKGNLLLFREQQKLNIWKMNHINNIQPKKLFEIKVSGRDHLISASISCTGSYVAYSSINKAQLLALKVDSSEGPFIQKINLNLSPATDMCFSNNEKLLVTVSKSINITYIDSYKTEVMELDSKLGFHLPFSHIAISQNDEYLCIVDSKSQCLIFSITEREYLTSLPNVSGRVCSLKFHPKTNNLFVNTSNKLIYEFDVQQDKFMPWLFDFNKSGLLTKMGFKKDKIYNITFNPENIDQVFIQSKEFFGRLNYGENIPLPENETSPKPKKRKLKDVFKTLRSFSNMMFLEFNSAGELIIVERPMGSILESLPDPMHIKKFGS